MRRDIAHDRGDLHHLHRMGQPMVREPQRRKAGVARRPHLLDDLRNALRDIEALGNCVLMNRPTFITTPDRVPMAAAAIP